MPSTASTGLWKSQSLHFCPCHMNPPPSPPTNSFNSLRFWKDHEKSKYLPATGFLLCRVSQAQNHEVDKEVSGLIQYYSPLIATSLIVKMPPIAQGAHQVCGPPTTFSSGGINLSFHSWSQASGSHQVGSGRPLLPSSCPNTPG